MTFDESFDRLVVAANDLAALLREHGEHEWSEWMARGGKRVRSGDYYGLVELLRAFGGMGSLNDLVIHPSNGHSIADVDVAPVNDRLSALVSEVWETANDLKAELDRR